MAANKMLIDASHPEETRVVVLRGNRIEEFDFESQNKRQLKGNIYLAKVTRVEPSLQAAFVDYGGNRHGFLAFNEIHPDYYQIPVADRQALLDEEAADARRDRDADTNNDTRANDVEVDTQETPSSDADENARSSSEEEKPAPKPRRRRSRRKKAVVAEETTKESTEESSDSVTVAPEENTDAEINSEKATASSDEENGAGDHSANVEDDQVSLQNETSSDSSEPDANSDESETDSKPTSIAAIMETDSISEPVADEDDSADDGASDDDSGKSTSDENDSESDKKEPAAKKRTRRTSRPSKKKIAETEAVATETPPVVEDEPKPAKVEPTDQDTVEISAEDSTEEKASTEEASEPAKPKTRRKRRSSKAAKSADKKPSDKKSAKEPNNNTDAQENDEVESTGQEDALEEVPRPRRPRKHYKIQEVIKRRQVLLVQVVKEERGNKGAALTTYLSLAGRYSVLMPNTARGGGISRKITNAADRKRLKSIASDLDVPEGMGVILRTAGASRTQAEIQRDFEYLMRLWENVRALTLSSSAPCLVYEEGSLIKRSIRDLYGKNTGEVLVAGEEGFQEARSFMEMLMPDHVSNVKLYQEEQAMFARFGVENQLDKMLSQQVTLKSGGYLVIDQTEALVAIDVNSGRATREHSIEDTALQTNLETAEEVARQLRLRDLAGLIVIDFIDMEENRNNRAVEKKLKDCLKHDRARIQVGRISHFGLLEMSRQRMRASVLESTMDVCPHCEGKGHLRSHSSVGLHILRSIEEHLLKNSRFDLVVKAAPEIALYILNHKRLSIMEIEERFGLKIYMEGNRDLLGENFTIEKGDASTGERKPLTFIQAGQLSADNETNDKAEPATASDTSEEKPAKRKRRRRRGRGGDDNATNAEPQKSESSNDDQQSETSGSDNSTEQNEAPDSQNDRNKRRRTRGKRGGRNARERDENAVPENEQATDTPAETSSSSSIVVEEPAKTEPAKRSRNSRPRKSKQENTAPVEPVETTSIDNSDAKFSENASKEPPRAKRRNTRRSSVEKQDSETRAAENAVDMPAEISGDDATSKLAESSQTAPDASSKLDNGSETDDKSNGEQAKKRGGWWSRTGFFN